MVVSLFFSVAHRVYSWFNNYQTVRHQYLHHVMLVRSFWNLLEMFDGLTRPIGSRGGGGEEEERRRRRRRGRRRSGRKAGGRMRVWEINLRICTRPPVTIKQCDKYLPDLLTKSTPTSPHTVQHSVSPGRFQ